MEEGMEGGGGEGGKEGGMEEGEEREKEGGREGGKEGGREGGGEEGGRGGEESMRMSMSWYDTYVPMTGSSLPSPSLPPFSHPLLPLLLSSLPSTLTPRIPYLIISSWRLSLRFNVSVVWRGTVRETTPTSPNLTAPPPPKLEAMVT